MPAQPDAREPRHQALHTAIYNELSHAVRGLTRLRDELSGPGDTVADSAPDAPVPSPADVYSGAPGTIRELSKQIRDLTGEIQEMVL